MKPLIQAVAFLVLGLVSSSFVSAHILKDDIEKVMIELEDGIVEYDNKAVLCELHNEIPVQTLYVISNPFRDFTKFKQTNKFCEEYK